MFLVWFFFTLEIDYGRQELVRIRLLIISVQCLVFLQFMTFNDNKHLRFLWVKEEKGVSVLLSYISKKAK